MFCVGRTVGRTLLVTKYSLVIEDFCTTCLLRCVAIYFAVSRSISRVCSFGFGHQRCSYLGIWSKSLLSVTSGLVTTLPRVWLLDTCMFSRTQTLNCKEGRNNIGFVFYNLLLSVSSIVLFLSGTSYLCLLSLRVCGVRRVRRCLGLMPYTPFTIGSRAL